MESRQLAKSSSLLVDSSCGWGLDNGGPGAPWALMGWCCASAGSSESASLPVAALRAQDLLSQTQMILRSQVYAASRKSILVVDDDESMREVISVLLSTEYRVVQAVDGVDGFLRANEVPAPDLIIADVSMPFLDGVAMVRRIRENEALRRVPVIFVTGQASSESFIAGLSVDSFAYLSKPIQLDVLEKKVKSALWH
jgi:CheY-like chemotaxis protein